MKKIFSLLVFIPFINRAYKRKYYATGTGTYIVNSFFKRILCINKGDFLVHFTSRVNTAKNITLFGQNKVFIYASLHLEVAITRR